ncbi:MAG: hypothetical protein AUJ92_19570 [Armatimonadetes bacterium CG2_30_59_28]|nr:MAG: hypothetical protein AUJ92_19570 [Armatimonadetes bacterium CG2_30_59_28]PIU67097.1 MAG: hypothetical protein COS85_02060 [Armatimonadetes bacterium CG07_land_8_20_14_0_80_59_28]PIY44053.1 MAG: hypothetical protein COZ05_09320 [Armatimonadetes bacterium CG_4_10_14_3_um_filter_59_10]PJB63362.1 MAG: hypothetical protein CO095_16630 [Armatimonadetes bacterium CG_4_9_14_3_um_filter_58_7]
MEDREMTARERVTAAFEHRPTDVVPHFTAGFSSYAASIVLDREAYVGGGIQQFREARALWQGEDAHQEYLERSRKDAFDLVSVLDMDLVRPAYWRLAEKPVRKIDEQTYLYGNPEKEWRVMRFDGATELYQVIETSPRPLLTMDDLEEQVKQSEAALEGWQPGESAYEEPLAAREAFPDHAIQVGCLGLNINYREPLWLEAIAERPDLVARTLDTQVERTVRSIELPIRMGFRFLFGGGDFASNKGPFYSPKFYHEVVFPRWVRMMEACHQRGAFGLFASDGNLWPVAADLFGAAKTDGFYEIDRVAGMDLRKLCERFPHLTLLGNISSATLHRGTKEQVIEETVDCIEAAKECGSILVGCSNQIVAGTPRENLMAMIETIAAARQDHGIVEVAGGASSEALTHEPVEVEVKGQTGPVAGNGGRRNPNV